MVINEKALVREMKKAFNSGGYHVIKHTKGTTIIYCGYWAVEIDDADVPRKVIGCLASDLHFLPDDKDAYKVSKGKGDPIIQTEIFDSAIAVIHSLENRVSKLTVDVMEKTILTYEGYSVWQNAFPEQERRVLLVNPTYEGIMDQKKDSCIYRAGEALYLEGSVSKAYILPVGTEKKEALLNHLAAFRWPTVNAK